MTDTLTGSPEKLSSLTALLLQYRTTNSVEGKSPKTIGWYHQNLILFVNYLKSVGLADDLTSFNIAATRGYLLYLKQRPKLSRYPGKGLNSLSPKTLQCHVRTLKAFSSWLVREGYTTENRLANVKIPKAPQKFIRPLAVEEKQKIFRCLEKKTPLGLRDRAIVALMLDTGLRAAGVGDVSLEHLNLDKFCLKVLEKGSKERMVSFGEVTQKILLRYIQDTRPRLLRHASSALFLTEEGEPMSTNALKLMFDRLRESSGILRLHAHLLRHTFATDYLINGGDIFTLKEILGHKTLDMVNQYLHFTTAQISVLHHKFSPMDKFLADNGNTETIKSADSNGVLQTDKDEQGKIKESTETTRNLEVKSESLGESQYIPANTSKQGLTWDKTSSDKKTAMFGGLNLAAILSKPGTKKIYNDQISKEVSA